MITIDPEKSQKIREKIGDNVLEIKAVESCCGYALTSNLSTQNEESGLLEQDNFLVKIDKDSLKIAPEILVSIDDESGALTLKNLAAKSYCACGNSFQI